MVIYERWLPVFCWEDLYMVSDLGRVLSLRTGKILRPQRSGGQSKEYLYVTLSGPAREDCKHRVQRRIAVHKVVLEAFVGLRPAGMQGCHGNGDKTDNRLVNLRWDTQVGNEADKKLHGTCYKLNKEQCPEGHDYTDENTYVWTDSKTGHTERHCRQCRRERYRQRHGKGLRTNRTRYNPAAH